MRPSEIVGSMQIAAKDFENKEIGAREKLLDLWVELRAELELPSQVISRLYYESHSLTACLEVAVDTQLFQNLHDAGESASTDMLAERTGITTSLLIRIMRHFAANRIVKYSNVKGWQATPLSNALATKSYQQSIIFCQQVCSSSFKAFSEHFKKGGYKHPSARNAPFHTAHGTSLQMFDWLEETNTHFEPSISLMEVYREGKVDWWMFYPVKERLSDGFNRAYGDAFIVDVGGSRGRDLKSLSESFSDLPGKLILQDQSMVIAGIPENDAFEAQSYDFFTPQPVKGARAYYLHSVLHDWSDDESVQILNNLKPAMRQHYSRVLLNEIAMDEGKLTTLDTAMDMMMLAHMGTARERSIKEWMNIAEKAGFVIENVFSNPGSPESIIELALKPM